MNKHLAVKTIDVKNFRCFKNKTIHFENPITLLYGLNGKGKTSIVEALYYACYLRSFKNYTPRDLIHFDNDSFFIKLNLVEKNDDELFESNIQVGFSKNKRLVKVNQHTISSYKELLNHYRIICVTEDDLGLIKEGPKIRRFFIDQALIMFDTQMVSTFKEFKIILEQRNQFINQQKSDQEEYIIWTKQLWHISQIIQYKREHLLSELQIQVNNLLHTFFDAEMNVSLTYHRKKMSKEDTFESFLDKNGHLYSDEIKYGYTLFGAHLDDFSITLCDKKSRHFLSRGQQKLIIMLIKIAHIHLLMKAKGGVIFLLDDFMTDFDSQKMDIIFTILVNIGIQLIFTSPLLESPLKNNIIKHDGIVVSID